MNNTIKEVLAVVATVAFIGFLLWGFHAAYKADRDHCHSLLQSSRSNTDTLIVISGRRCAFIGKDMPDVQ